MINLIEIHEILVENRNGERKVEAVILNRALTLHLFLKLFLKRPREKVGLKDITWAQENLS